MLIRGLETILPNARVAVFFKYGRGSNVFAEMTDDAFIANLKAEEASDLEFCAMAGKMLGVKEVQLAPNRVLHLNDY